MIINGRSLTQRNTHHSEVVDSSWDDPERIFTVPSFFPNSASSNSPLPAGSGRGRDLTQFTSRYGEIFTTAKSRDFPKFLCILGGSGAVIST